MTFIFSSPQNTPCSRSLSFSLSISLPLKCLHPWGQWSLSAGATSRFTPADPRGSGSGLAPTQPVLGRLWRQIHLCGLSGCHQETSPHQHRSEWTTGNSTGSPPWVRRRRRLYLCMCVCVSMNTINACSGSDIKHWPHYVIPSSVTGSIIMVVKQLSLSVIIMTIHWPARLISNFKKIC